MDQEQTKKQCKICLMDNETEEDFFVSPCNCKGTCQYVHFQCLKQWVESKVSKKDLGTCFAYNWKKGECELCKTPLPKKIIKGKQEMELVDIVRPEMPYLILQNLSKDKKISKNLFIIYGLKDSNVCLVRMKTLLVYSCNFDWTFCLFFPPPKKIDQLKRSCLKFFLFILYHNCLSFSFS